MKQLNICDKFTAALPADPIEENTVRQVPDACFSYVLPKIFQNPSLVSYSEEMATELGFSNSFCESEEFAQFMTGQKLFPGSKPYAMNYGGHQFGSWAGQLGDGRAINLGEITHKGKSWVLQLKGAGPTPYSRMADGLAVLRSSIREYLCSEAMYHLGVPTTRALSLCLTGEMVLRDMMYDGNAAWEKGAIVCRVAPNFIRFGNFEILTARKNFETLRKLADFCIANYFPEIDPASPNRFLDFFKSIADKTMLLMVEWQRVGFVHGVMNTDNMSISGLTIDYGPYGWLDDYNPDWTPNTTDRDTKRYRFGNQPPIAQWNLIRLANALYPLIGDTKILEEVLNEFPERYYENYYAMMCKKLGFGKFYQDDIQLIKDLESLLQLVELDMTIFFRQLSEIAGEDNSTPDFEGIFEIMSPAFYPTNELSGNIKTKYIEWLAKYCERLLVDPLPGVERRAMMNRQNPKYVLRNYIAQMVIDEAENGKYELLEEVRNMLKTPYDESPNYEKWYTKRPDWAKQKIGCSMLSCSS